MQQLTASIWEPVESNLQTITANVSGGVRRAIRNGREHLVAPLSLIVPGVLAGNKGPLYYPPEEVKKNYTVWNETPIVLYHPHINGKPVSALDGNILEDSGIGVVLKPIIKNGRLRAEGWFDAERTKSVDSRIYDSLISGKPIELSTGLFTDNELAPDGAQHNGRSYKYIARNYRPDHLAILPDQVGACSIHDGCGVLVNAFCPTGEGGGQDNSCSSGKGRNELEPLVDIGSATGSWNPESESHKKLKARQGQKGVPVEAIVGEKKVEQMDYHLSKQKEYAESAIKAKREGNHGLAKQLAAQSESHANEIHSLKNRTKRIARLPSVSRMEFSLDPAKLAKATADREATAKLMGVHNWQSISNAFCQTTDSASLVLNEDVQYEQTGKARTCQCGGTCKKCVDNAVTGVLENEWSPVESNSWQPVVPV